jgi:FkbM family methyltransferase
MRIDRVRVGINDLFLQSVRKYIHILVAMRRHLLGQLPVPEIAHLAPFIAPNTICLDIGAHGGSWTRPLAKLVPQGEVHAFEALPYYAFVLSKTFKIIGPTNITIYNRAVNEFGEDVELVWQSSGVRLTGKTHIRSEHETAAETIRVTGIALDAFDQTLIGGKRISFIKMDIEGAELAALKGAESMLAAHRPIVFAEVDERWTPRYGYTPADVFQLMSSYRYIAKVINPITTLLEPITAETYRNRGDVFFFPE